MAQDKSTLIIQEASIPSLPLGLQKILQLSSSPTTSSQDLQQHVMREPGLSTKLLRLANSAYYSLPHRISSIQHAIIIIGFASVKSIAAGLGLIDTFSKLPDANKELVQSIWRYSLMKAACVRILARSEDRNFIDDLYLAAMVHKVGYIVMSQYFQSYYQDINEMSDLPDEATEMTLFETTHKMVAAELLASWQFPEAVIAIVKGDGAGEEQRPEARYLESSEYLTQQLINNKAYFDEPDLPELEETPLAAISWDWAALQAERGAFEEAIQSAHWLCSS